VDYFKSGGNIILDLDQQVLHALGEAVVDAVVLRRPGITEFSFEIESVGRESIDEVSHAQTAVLGTLGGPRI